AQYSAIRRWTSGSIMADYVFGSIRNFDYSPYVPTMQAASTSGVVDATVPTMTVSTPGASGGTVVSPGPSVQLAGTAKDDFAVQSLAWVNSTTGVSGAAAMMWRLISGSANLGYVWTLDWTITAPVV